MSYESENWIGHFVENEILRRMIYLLAFYEKISWSENSKHDFEKFKTEFSMPKSDFFTK